MSEKVDDLLESVIRISKERDKKSLERVLVETLSDFIENEGIALLRVPHDGEDLEESIAIPKDLCQKQFNIITRHFGNDRIQLNHGLSTCINKSEIVNEEQGKLKRTFYPIENNNSTTGVLVILGNPDTEHSNHLIRGFLRIYSNFLNILNDNEHDTLTGLLNRKTFDSRINELISLARTEATHASDRRHLDTEKSHWLGILDIDHFKKINDTYGHIYGDEVLILFSNMMKQVFRNSDLLFRYGGEEFVVVLSPNNASDAMHVFERFRQQLALYKFPQVGFVTASIGMVKISAHEHPTAVVEHADKALYYAKEHGRNQTRNYHELVADGLLQERRNKSDIELF